MTKKEAIKQIEVFRTCMIVDDAEPYVVEALNMAVEALEQQPCDDCIRRSDIGLTDFEMVMCNGDYKEALKMLLDKIENAPSVNLAEKESDKCVKYKNVAMDLLIEYLESEQAVISEYSGNFKESALALKKQVLGYLKRLDEGENTFNELVKDMWISDYYKAEGSEKE